MSSRFRVGSRAREKLLVLACRGEGDDESVKIWRMRDCGYCVREIMEGDTICKNFQCEFLRERELSNGKREWEVKSDLQGSEKKKEMEREMLYPVCRRGRCGLGMRENLVAM
ncbi:hypothetical protein COLO4_05685 [Corchorus olitorius]|uniref:Uncharacterized protein n=1 Tax=Corchorus olitorius TaxID=93759 RepID=A0A1R3KQ56_9ROSI|nr:hypothetical protein COLO4_05685 [Corchorus olitorius]